MTWVTEILIKAANHQNCSTAVRVLERVNLKLGAEWGHFNRRLIFAIHNIHISCYTKVSHTEIQLSYAEVAC